MIEVSKKTILSTLAEYSQRLDTAYLTLRVQAEIIDDLRIELDCLIREITNLEEPIPDAID